MKTPWAMRMGMGLLALNGRAVASLFGAVVFALLLVEVAPLAGRLVSGVFLLGLVSTCWGLVFSERVQMALVSSAGRKYFRRDTFISFGLLFSALAVVALAKWTGMISE